VLDLDPPMQEIKETSVREAWVLCLILGIVMINFPFVHIFNTVQLIFGIPKLVLYFFIGWPVSIVVIWFFVCNTTADEQPNPDPENEDSL
jgi:hypothetical protein